MLKEEQLGILLRNFVEFQKNVEIAFLYSNQGLLISKYVKSSSNVEDSKELENVHGAFTAMVENLLEKMSSEYQIGHYGSGSFETSDHRIIYLEAGSDAILLLLCDYETNLNFLFPMAYLVVEKIAQILEESFDLRYNTLDIPDLWADKNFSLKLENYNVSNPEPVIDGVYPLHQIKIKEKTQRLFKLIILGSAAVGKTTLVNQFLKKDQIADYRPTLGISISAQKYFIQGNKNESIKFLIYDLAGQEFFKRVRHDYYRGANCAFVMYDVTRKETFDEAINFWFDDARKELGNIPFVLIGNKIDLENQREIQKEQGIKKASELKCFFTETSALKNMNVQDTFKLVGIGLFFQYY
jgi:small GTP-binding protein